MQYVCNIIYNVCIISYVMRVCNIILRNVCTGGSKQMLLLGPLYQQFSNFHTYMGRRDFHTWEEETLIHGKASREIIFPTKTYTEIVCNLFGTFVR